MWHQIRNRLSKKMLMVQFQRISQKLSYFQGHRKKIDCLFDDKLNAYFPKLLKLCTCLFQKEFKRYM